MSNPDLIATATTERDPGTATKEGVYERWQREVEPYLPPTYRDWLRGIYREQGVGFKTFCADVRRITKNKRRLRKLWNRRLPNIYVEEICEIEPRRGVEMITHLITFGHYYHLEQSLKAEATA